MITVKQDGAIPLVPLGIVLAIFLPVLGICSLLPFYLTHETGYLIVPIVFAMWLVAAYIGTPFSWYKHRR